MRSLTKNKHISVHNLVQKLAAKLKMSNNCLDTLGLHTAVRLNFCAIIFYFWEEKIQFNDFSTFHQKSNFSPSMISWVFSEIEVS